MASGSKKELNDYLLNVVCKQVCEYAANEVYSAINYFLAQYYREYTPISYIRSEQFLRSAFKTTAKKSGNRYVAEIGIDYESLDDYENATGYEIVFWSNQALHGNVDVGTNTRVWDDAMSSTIYSGQLLADCIAFLKGKGFKITS